MKFFAVFAAVLAVACASPAQWTINELSSAIQNPSTPATLVPVLEEALNELMLQAYLGGQQTTTTVSTVVQDFSAWTLHELSEALENPATDPQLIVYLEHALDSMMFDLMSGNQPEYVIVATPVGLLPVEATIVPTPVESVVPSPAESVVAPSSPLVQIIVNVKSQQESGPAPVEAVHPIIPSPVVLPQPVLPEVVYPQPVVLPEPVLPVVVPSPVVLPQPAIPEVNPVVPSPVVLPQPVAPVVQVPVNPIDVIAVAAPDVNPIDILAPVPVVPVNVGDIVGPIV